MAVNALAPNVIRTSATKLLSTQYEHVLVLYKEGFQLPVPLQSEEMRKDANIFSEMNSRKHGLRLAWNIHKNDTRQKCVCFIGISWARVSKARIQC